MDPALQRERRPRRRSDHGPRVWASDAGAACDHRQLVALGAARLPALLQQGHAQHAAPHSGAHPLRRAATCSVLFCLHVGNTGV